MQSVFEAASHIAQEIERTRQHLANLEQALQGLRPLITVEAPANALTYSEATASETVEDASIVVAKPIKRVRSNGKARKYATKVKQTASSAELPSTGTALWLKALGAKKMTIDQLVDSVMSKLALGASARSAIRNRAGAWLHIAVKKGQVMAVLNSKGIKTYKAVTA